MKTNALKLSVIVLAVFILVGYVVDNNSDERLSTTTKKVIEHHDAAAIVSLFQFVDQLKTHSKPELVLNSIHGFGGIFSKENLALEETKQLLEDITKHLDSLRTQNTSALLETVISEGTTALLPKHLKEDFEVAREEILTTNTKVVLTSAAYNYIYVLNEVVPKLKKLLAQNKKITEEEFLTAFYEAKIAKLNITIVKNMLKDVPKELLHEIISTKEASELQAEILKYEAVVQLHLGALKKYKEEEVYKEQLKTFLKEQTLQKNAYYIEEYERLEAKIAQVTNNILHFEKALLKEYESLQDLLNKKVTKAVVKAQEHVDGILGSHNYIDIIPNYLEKKPDCWLRVKLPENTVEYIREHKEIKGISGKLYLVYKTKVFDDKATLSGTSFIPGVDMNSAQINSLKQSLQKIVSEIPLGIEIANLAIEEKDAQNTALTCTGYDGKNDPLHNLQITIPQDSPWTNFKTILKEQKEVFNRLQVSKELGLQLDHITLNPKNFDATFSFHVGSSSIVRDLLNIQKETNSFEFTLSEIQKETQFISDKLRELAGKKIASRLQEVLDDTENEKHLQNLLLADSILTAKATYSQDYIVGHVTYVPIGFTALNKKFEQTASVELLFKTSLKNGKAAVSISNTSLPYEASIRAYVNRYLNTSKDSLLQSVNRTLSASEVGNLMLNLSQKLQFSKFQLNYRTKEITGKMWIEGFAAKKMPISITKRGLRIEHIEAVFKEIIKSTFETYVVSQFEQTIQKKCHEFVANKEVSLFTFDFRFEDINCNLQNTSASFKAVYKEDPANFASIQFDASGNLKILELNAPVIERNIVTKIETNLAQYTDFKYLKVKNPRFEKGILKIDAFVQIEAIGLYEQAGTFEIAPDTKNILDAKFNGFDLQTAFESKVNSKVKENIKELIKDKKLTLEFSKEADGLSITDIKEVLLFGSGRRLVFEAQANLKGIIVPGFTITINLAEEDMLKAIRIDLPNTAIINALLANTSLMNDLSAEIVPGLNARIEKMNVYANPVRIEGFLQLEVNNLTFPSMRFEVTQNNIRFHPSLSFPLPGAYLIAASPPLTLYGTYVWLDLEEKRISLNTNITVGTPADAEASSRLLNLKGSLGAYYAKGKFGNLDLEANLYLITVLNVLEGKGALETTKGCFSMSSKTKGPLGKVVKFNNQVTVNCDDILFRSQMAMDVLGVKMNSDMSAEKVSNSAIKLAGNINYNFLETAYLRGAVATKLQTGDVTSFAKNATISLAGNLKIDRFELSELSLDANYNSAYLDFEVLGVNLGIEVPTVGNFSEDMILEKILSLLDFDPEMILEILKNPTKISFKIAPMGIGKKSKGGKEGTDNDSGGGVAINEDASVTNGKESTKKAVSKLVDNGANVQVTSGAFASNLKVKLLPLQSIQSFPRQQKSKFPENVTRALVTVDTRNNAQSAVNYLANETASQIQSGFNYWITQQIVSPIKRLKNVSTYKFNKQILETSYYPSICWNVCFNNNNNVYLYLSQPYVNTYQADEFEFSELQKEWVTDYDFIRLRLTNREQLVVNQDNTFIVQQVPLKISNRAFVNYRNSVVHLSSNTLFFKRGNKFFNTEGKNITSTNLIKGSTIRKLKRQYPTFETIKAIAVSDRNLLILKDDDFEVITAFKIKKEDEVKQALEKTADTLGKVWIEIPQSAINAVFGQEPWFNSGKKFHENIKTLQSNTYQGKIKTKAYRSFEALVQSLLEDNVVPNTRVIPLDTREYLLTTNNDTNNKTLVNLTPKQHTNFFNYIPPTLRITNSDLTKDLAIENSTAVDFENIFKTNRLVSNTLIHIMDGRLFNGDVYLGKSQDNLFFQSSNQLKIQSKDSLWTIKTALDINTLVKDSNQEQAGDIFNKPQAVKKHATFFNTLFSIISSGKDVELVLEENESKLVAYLLDKTDLHIIWENSNGTEIGSRKFERTVFNAALMSTHHTKAELKLVNSIHSKSYTLQELVKFIKKGYIPTKDWFSKDNDFVHSLTLLK
ncbi:hypothetical protein P8625_15700 [Tenacibaculum tangerinum]|uniref:Uncharacterized protein n=1 Tax=Tenacibaculum tangerinum TaxID=3038772 RepID=A0ABY8L225_9FLAO|nr:hypothetical protein [Tenacibaculum tangerinum]WGH75489.1 hypothetical protein P8625_15700 [Tenacibaculum tangerinum]